MWCFYRGCLQSSCLKCHLILIHTLKSLLLLFSHQVCPTLRPHGCSTTGRPVSHFLAGFAQVYVHWIGDAIQPSHPLLPSSFCLQSFAVSGYFPVTQLFVVIRWPKYWNFSFIFSPSNGLISFWIDRFDLLAIQGTLKNLLQNYNLKTSILQHSAFFMLQLSYLYITTERPCALCCS